MTREAILNCDVVFARKGRGRAFSKGTVIKIARVTEHFGVDVYVAHAPGYQRSQLDRQKFHLDSPLHRLARVSE